MICFKRLQSYRTNPTLRWTPLVDHVVGRVRVNEGRDDLIVRGIPRWITYWELHVKNRWNKRTEDAQIDQTCTNLGCGRRFIARSLIGSIVILPFFQWQQKKRRVHFYQYSHQTKQRESNCTRSLSLKPWVYPRTHRLSGCIVWNCM